MSPTTILASCFLIAQLLSSCKASSFKDSSKKGADQPASTEKAQTNQGLSGSTDPNKTGGEGAGNPVNITGIYLTCAAAAPASSTSGYGCSLVNDNSQTVNLANSFKQYQWDSSINGTAPTGVTVRSEATSLAGQQVGVYLAGGSQQERDSTMSITIVNFTGTTTDNQNVNLNYRLSDAINQKASPINPTQTSGGQVQQQVPANTATSVAGVPVTTITTGSQSFALCPTDAQMKTLGAQRWTPGSRQTSSDGKYYFDYIKDNKTGTLTRDFCAMTGDAKWQYENSNAGDGCTCLTAI